MKCGIIILLFFTFTAICIGEFNIYTNVTEGLPKHIESPFMKIGKNYYFIESLKQVNWYGAVNACRKMGANLVSIESAEEANALYAYLRTLENVPDPWEFWLSGYDLEKKGEYIWQGTGQPLNYTDWANCQPSNGSERCLLLWRECDETLGECNPNFWSCSAPECDWKMCWKINWNDAPCDVLANYICEANTPKTATVTVW